jgi:phospholipid/cholesterol/gamma-HCH transport system substrate-binding protein
MRNRPPSIGRILAAVGFTLSCFGLILFLWIAFGGPTPLRPESYRITAYFPEATQLAQESDVRIGGVTVGKVKELELAPPQYRVAGNDTTAAELEIEPEFAPISSDARAILRQKTLLGETYVELAPGADPSETAAPISLGAAANVSDAEAEGVEPIEEGGSLGVARTQDATQIDEIFNALDAETRTSFQRWLEGSAAAVEGRGLDLNDAFGNLGPFVSDADELLAILRDQKVALQGLVRDTGTVFEALSERDRELAGVITGANDTFGALAAEQRALAESLQILPTFELESRVTLERLDEFQAATDPLVRDLIPVARDLSPTLASIRRLSPDLERLFENLDPLISASKDGFPALRNVLGELAPTLAELDPFLANLNPVLRYLELQKGTVTDFLAGPAAALSNSLDPVPGQPAARHYLRRSRSTRRASTPTVAMATSRRDRSTTSPPPPRGSSPTSTARTPTISRRPRRARRRPRTRRSCGWASPRARACPTPVRASLPASSTRAPSASSAAAARRWSRPIPRPERPARTGGTAPWCRQRRNGPRAPA